MNGITLNKLSSISSSKGMTVEWCKGLPGKQVTFYYRPRGSQFAYHFHKGEDSSKVPERFFLIAGKVKMLFWNGKETETVTLESGTEMLIDPYIYHEAETLEDAIFAEYRATPFDEQASDVYSKQDFIEYVSQHQAN